MTLTEANAQAAQLLTVMRMVMPHASDREILNAVAGDIRAPWDAPDRIARDYDLLRRSLDGLVHASTPRGER